MKLVLLTLLASFVAASCSNLSPYTGYTERPIKALSDREVTSLKNGMGMGYALAAELNQYPGPMHVLEMARELELTAQQRQLTEQLMATHKQEAKLIGFELIDAERQLNDIFASKTATAENVTVHTQKVALIQAKLRASHLVTHVKQTVLLSPDQIARYQNLRGY
jgi:hypothetical protein